MTRKRSEQSKKQNWIAHRTKIKLQKYLKNVPGMLVRVTAHQRYYHNGNPPRLRVLNLLLYYLVDCYNQGTVERTHHHYYILSPPRLTYHGNRATCSLWQRCFVDAIGLRFFVVFEGIGFFSGVDWLLHTVIKTSFLCCIVVLHSSSMVLIAHFCGRNIRTLSICGYFCRRNRKNFEHMWFQWQLQQLLCRGRKKKPPAPWSGTTTPSITWKFDI